MPRTFDALVERCRADKLTICSDSRKVLPGAVFVAVPGTAEDGARYIPDAVRAGAGVVVCKPGVWEGDCDAAAVEVVRHDDPREALWCLAEARWGTGATRMKILGVTGTNGKTTCAYLLERLFMQAGCKTGVLGTVNYRWPGHCEPAALTTPDPLRIHAMLSAMEEAGCSLVVMEVSSHAIAQQRICGIPFAGAAFTNLTQDHLDFHGNMDDYFQTKARLFLEFPKTEKAVAVNSDDIWGKRLLELCPNALAYGLEAERTSGRRLWGELLSAGTDGCRLRMHLDRRTWELHSPLVGAFNAANLLTVQALALELGMDSGEFAALEGFAGVNGRLERIENPQGLDVFVDYAHTPDALVNVLKALRQAGFQRIVTVFGCGGNRDRGKRPLMGEAVAKYSDVAVLTSDNPRFEDPEDILRDVLPGLKSASTTVVEPDRRSATEKALTMLRKGDALLIAGKGHENYQVVQGVRRHYSDQEVVRELLQCG